MGFELGVKGQNCLLLKNLFFTRAIGTDLQLCISYLMFLP